MKPTVITEEELNPLKACSILRAPVTNKKAKAPKNTKSAGSLVQINNANTPSMVTMAIHA
jgi:hypothetical protein